MFIQSPKAFANVVRTQRLHNNMTQEELSSRTGMSRRWVQELEAGKLVPSLEAALSVAAAFGYEFHLEPTSSSTHLDALFDELS